MAGRIGFLGGTFDPPHRGHVELARLGRDRLSLERVLLAPTAVQPLKQREAPGATWQQRLAMVELAIAGQEKLHASTVDAPRDAGRPNYSADTLARVRELFPEREIYFLLGADAFAGLRRWHDPERLLAQCELAVASRPGYELPTDGNDLLEWMPDGARFLGTEDAALVFLVGSALVRVHLLEDMAEDIAATDLRAQLSRGEGFDWLTPAVADYVRKNHLYGT